MQILSATYLALCSVLLSTFADAAATSHRPRHDLVRHEWHEPRHIQGWKRRDRLTIASTDHLLPMRIGFVQSDGAVQKAHSMLMDRADPASPLYGQHLTADAVADLFAPASEAVEAVKRWVVESGGVAADRVSLSANRQWLQFDAHVDEAEQLLQAKFYSYEHLESGVNLTACPEYHVPATLQQHIDYITPGTKLASYGFSDGVKALGLSRRDKDTNGTRLQRRTEQATATAATTAAAPWVTGGCDEFATFECIRAQYGLPLPSSLSKVTPVSGNQLGIFETAGQHYSQDDLDIFFSYTAPEIPVGTKPELRAIDGATGPAATQDAAGAEANMDFEVAMPLVWPQKTVLFQVDDEYYENAMTSGSGKVKGIFNTFFDAIDGSYCTLNAYGQTGNCQDPACIDPVYPNPNNNNGGGKAYQGQLMCGTFKPTNVISISYENAENSLPANYLRRQCLELMKLGLQGVTVVVAAGDNGVGGNAANGGDAHKGCLGSQHDIFSPVSLATCPYALSVGATKLQAAAAAASKGTFVEVGPTDFYTGGGFSNIYPTPDWQQSAVATYLGRAKLGFGGYSGDAVPENSGTNFNKSGRAYPDVSALGSNFYMVYRGGLAKGGGTSVAAPVWAAVLSQVNEARLRANKTAVGHVQPVLYKHPEVFTDVVEGSNPGCGTTGFVATAGWDPVSGLGTPIFPKLRDLFLSLA